MAKSQLIISGSIALDRIMNFTGNYRELIKPDKLHVLSLSVLLDKIEETPGGTGANIAWNSALLGNKPILLGSVGPDATDYRNRLAAAGVDTANIHTSQLPTASFNVMTDSENNQVGGFYPGAMADAAGQTLKPWSGQQVLVCVSANDPAAMAAAVEECARYGLPLMYDPGQQVSSPAVDLQAGVKAAEVLILNDYELGVLCGRTKLTPEQLKSKVPVVITTLGKDGSVIEGKDAAEPIAIPAVPPVAVTDPTGAGDAYRAGFLHGYLRQWPLQDCGRLGATVASFIVENHGTQVQVSPFEVTSRYQAAFKQEITL